jgi:dienelactone hydrolase
LSEGQPDEKGLKIDAQCALNHLLQHPEIDTKKIVIFGQSIGGAVAIHLTAQNSDKVYSSSSYSFRVLDFLGPRLDC